MKSERQLKCHLFCNNLCILCVQLFCFLGISLLVDFSVSNTKKTYKFVV